jgi:hypothetical protein
MKVNLAEAGSSAAGPKNLSVALCVWGDHSTLGAVFYLELASAAAGTPASLEDAAAVSAKLRNDVRVKL